MTRAIPTTLPGSLTGLPMGRMPLRYFAQTYLLPPGKEEEGEMEAYRRALWGKWDEINAAGMGGSAPCRRTLEAEQEDDVWKRMRKF